MIITGDYQKEITRFLKQLKIKFNMKNLRGHMYFLRIEVARSKQGISLSQRKKCARLVARSRITGVKAN